ncbi:MAG: hypothetical protein HFI70_01705 [Lachnospiraceae bacterium]|nr:hypothetical protein [Lachnospiraceae bacterium]
MNKYRLNQILEILTFPYTDMKLIKKDLLAERENAYCAFLDSTKIFNIKRRNEYSKRYEKAHRDFGRYLCSCCTGIPKSLDDVLLIGEKFFPHKVILEKMESVCQKACRKDMVMEYYMENIFQIAYSLLTSWDGVVSIRTWNSGSEVGSETDILGTYDVFDKVEIWNTLTRIVTPDLLIAAFVCMNGSKLQMLYGQGASISLADKLLMRNLEKGTAETHLHINVSSDYLMLWEKSMNFTVWREGISQSESRFNNYDYVLFHVSVYRCLTAYFLEGFAGESYEDYINNGFDEVVGSMENPERNLWKTREDQRTYFEKVQKRLRDIFGKPLDAEEMGEKDVLYSILYEEYEHLGTSAEYIFLVKALTYIKEKRDIEFIRLFLQYIRIKNTFFSKIFQRNSVQGLNWFHEHYSRTSASFRRWMSEESLWNYILHTQVNMKTLKKLEFRMSVDLDLKFYDSDNQTAELEVQKEILKGIRRFLVNYKKFIAGRNQAPTIGIVLHFSKRKYLDNVSGFFCWRLIDEPRLYDSQHKIALRRKYVYIAKAVAAIRNEISYLDEYLVGVDVASDENAAEPWLFTPAYHEVRKGNNAALVKFIAEENIYKHINSIGLTYHVGEDYRHILSGLRHIDEVVEKYHYRACDRIGHGIALGVDVDDWAGNNRNVIIPLGEYLDNLLWIWGLVVENRQELPVSAYALEGKILQIASQIYTHMAGMTVHVLYQAYQEKFKRNFTERFRQYNREMEEKESSAKIQGKCLYRDYDSCHVELWDAFKIVCTYFCPVYEEKYNQVIWLEITGEDVKLLKALQNYMKDKIQRKGIYIETNPTSNLAIGEIESLYSHYILNLNTLADVQPKHNIMVTVNSDDPMVFNTNVENELAYMYHGLLSAGYDSKTVLEWIDKVREYGMESSFIKKVKSVEEMREEIGIMEQEIEKFLKK